MASKDLNLTLDKELTRGAVSRKKRASGPRAIQPARPGQKTQGMPRAWPTAALIMLLNITFMVALVFWLTGGDWRNFPDRPGRLYETIGKLETQLAAVDTRITELSKELGPQLEASSAAVQELTTSVELLHEQVGQLHAQIPPAPASTEKPAPPKQADEWIVNLGSFSQKAAARALVTKCEDLGYEPEIIQSTSAGESLYLVALTGFENRDAAESRARTIMEQTELNGLWASKRE